ncbi:MAG: glycosyltransferase [Actinomycetia bacterium]|nr:glycosyltransferase [Actinomycetes bacterium]
MENGLRRVLIISYNYPPGGTYGSVRAMKLAKYLPSRGWQPTVLTVSRDRTRLGSWSVSDGILPGVKVVRAPFPDILTSVKDLLSGLGLLRKSGPGTESRPDLSAGKARSLKSFLEPVFWWAKRWASFPDRYALWFPFAFLRGLLELRSGDYDAILSTSPPFMDHLVASALQRVSGLPWVADCRDPWSQNPYQEFTPLELRAATRLEKKALSPAGAIITVSEPLADLMKELHGGRPGGVLTITNGFDPDDYPGRQKLKKGAFLITHTGMFYGKKRDPVVILETVEELIDEGAISREDVRLRFYGPEGSELPRIKESLKYREIIEIGGFVPHSESIAHQRESTVLLTPLWEHPYSAMGYGGKVFEYMGSRRPILAWNPAGGVLVDLLRETGAGVSVAERSELKKVLSMWFDQFRETGTVKYEGSVERINRYGWGELASRMAAALAGVADTDRPVR